MSNIIDIQVSLVPNDGKPLTAVVQIEEGGWYHPVLSIEGKLWQIDMRYMEKASKERQVWVLYRPMQPILGEITTNPLGGVNG